MTITDIVAAAEEISRRDAYQRAALVRDREEAEALLAVAREHQDVDLENALRDLATWHDWDLCPTSGRGGDV